MEKFFKIFLLLVEVASDVLQKLLENRYQADNIPDFTIFLQQKQHELFHLCFTRSRTCCSCQMQNNAPNQQQSISKTLFDKMFSETTSRALCGKKIGTHSCKYDVEKGLKLTHLDVTLGTSLILNFYKAALDRSEADCVTDIRNVRNEIAHHAVNDDLTDNKFQENWGKIATAAVRLASCVSQNYRSEIEGKIEDLHRRKIYDHDILVQRVLSWQEDNEERMNAFAQELQEMHGKIDQVTTDIRRMQLTRNKDENCHRSRLQDASPERRGANGREPLQDTEDRCQSSTEVKQEMEDEDQKYYKTYNEIEQLRLNGKDDPKDAWKYLMMCLIALRGSCDEDMDNDVLENMGNIIFGSSVTTPADIKVCLLELTPKFIENVDSTYTAVDVSISKAVVFSYGYVSPSHLSNICTADILYDFVLPDCIETDDILIKVDCDTLVKHIIEKIQDNPRRIGEYLRKLRQMKRGRLCISKFADEMAESDVRFSADHMINLVDGLTGEGDDFGIFQKEKKMINVIFRPIDKFDNTLFHYFVVKFPESEKFMRYSVYFSGETIITALPNADNLTPLYLAAYLGRYGVVSCIVPNMESSDLEKQLWDILSNVEDGIELLRNINSDKEVSSKIHIEIPRFNIGNIKEFLDILDILGVGHNDMKPNNSEDTTSGDSKNGSSNCSKEDDDVSKVVGDKIITLVTNIKKGLDAITQIPELVKTINQATKLEKDK